MNPLCPSRPEDLAEALGTAAAASKRILLGGAFSKQRLGRPASAPDTTISTSAMKRVLQYEPRDLTISIEAGLPFADLTRLLAEHRQMVPLDPPFFDTATVGGVIASNLAGPRRRAYGTARDLIIGTTFATLEGKLVQSGGMVVKNAAGLDMTKLLIGSLGTLAAIAVVNFKLLSIPAVTRTFLWKFDTLADSLNARDTFLRGAIQPAALDLLNPPAAWRIGREGFVLLMQAGGTPTVIDRCTRELTASETLDGQEEQALWRSIREFTPDFLAQHPNGATVRICSTLAGLRTALVNLNVPVVTRAGTGASCAHYANWRDAIQLLQGRKAVLEFGPLEDLRDADCWQTPGQDFAMMEKVKQIFDPKRILNPGRLYGRL